jgi:hypothetical protein
MSIFKVCQLRHSHDLDRSHVDDSNPIELPALEENGPSFGNKSFSLSYCYLLMLWIEPWCTYNKVLGFAIDPYGGEDHKPR